jgi:predicted nucleotidyltransferase
MRTTAPQLLPLFRSHGQGRLLARIYLHEPATLATLARDLDLDDGGVKREADRLERAGLIRSERVGRSRILRPNDASPYYRDLYGLLLKAFGPAAIIAPELDRIEGVERAFLFGSWAARYHDEVGDDPADIDVMVIGRPSQLALAKTETELSESLGREVNIVDVSPEAWASSDSGFLREVRARPVVELDLGGAVA